jgi:hypothetical protein
MQLSKASYLKIAVALALFLGACKENAPPKSKEKTEENSDDAGPVSPPYQPSPASPDTSLGDPCQSNASGEEEEEEIDEEDDPFGLTGTTLVKKKVKTKAKKKKSGAKKIKGTQLAAKPGFKLVESVSYESDIRSILESKCTSLAKTALSSSIAEIEADKMPMDAPLSSGQKEKFRAWRDAGAPELGGSSNTDTETDTYDSGEGSSSDCGSSNGDTDEFGDGYNDLLNPEGLEECKDKGKIYDRKADECHKADIAEFSCDKAGIVAAFKKAGISSAESNVSTILSNGWEIDQCGEYDGQPIVYFIMPGDNSGDTVSLKVKKLCNPNKSVCK